MTTYHADKANPEVLLSRLDGVQKSGNGWRARCPACGGQSRKLSVAEVDGRVLVHCFACNDAEAVLAAIGLRWADLYPPRHWPQSPQERESARRAIREAGIASAVEVLALESCIVAAAAVEVEAAAWLLSPEDADRLHVAVARINDAKLVLCRPQSWRAAA